MTRRCRAPFGRPVHPGGIRREPERVLEAARARRRQPDGPALRLRADPVPLDEPAVEGGAQRARQMMALLAPVDAVAHERPPRGGGPVQVTPRPVSTPAPRSVRT